MCAECGNSPEIRHVTVALLRVAALVTDVPVGAVSAPVARHGAVAVTFGVTYAAPARTTAFAPTLPRTPTPVDGGEQLAIQRDAFAVVTPIAPAAGRPVGPRQ